MTRLHHLLRYAPLAFGGVGLLLFVAYGVLTGELWRGDLVPITGIVIGTILVLSNLGHAIDSRWRRPYYAGLLVAYAAGILFMGLRAKGGHVRFDEFGMSQLFAAGGFSPYDITMNIVGFIPLGFLVVVTLAEARRLRDDLRRFVASVLACGLASLAIEMSQQLIPGRSSSVIDVATNLLGGLMGAAFAVAFVRAWREEISGD